MNNKSYFILAISYLILIFALFFYSFTQVDLNLTLPNFPITRDLQNIFIKIGYFQRPLSAVIFLIIILLLILFYFLFLSLVKKNKFTERKIWFLLIFLSGILLFAYAAFSYDLFNYLFWARIFTHYGLSPYQFRPLDFPDDSWIRFMRWTHTTYNHGPVFLGLSLIPSFLGLGKFTLTLFNFKLLMTLGYLGSAFFISKIMEKIKPQDKLFSLFFFAFNPLIIIESLVSSHNDILMLFFALVSFYLLILRKKISSFFFLFLSFGIKFISVSFLPFYFLALLRKNVNWFLFIKMLLFGFLVSLIPVIVQRESYPWYFITVIGMASLIAESRFVTMMTMGLTLGLLLRYAPFLYFGHYQPPVSDLTLWLTLIPLGISLLIWIITGFYSLKFSKRKS
ncbi:hypothetical protein M1545_03955 [Patescibacteria group bacterium]|nr:hypothetical protein [Patescibacteria group bacterium]